MKAVLLLTFILLSPQLKAEDGDGDGSLYSPVGKRDPFRAPSTTDNDRDPSALKPIERFSLEQFKLVAILKGEGKARAMFVDPSGNSFIVPEGGLIGRERAVISLIREYTVLITEQTTNYRGESQLYERVISLPKN